VKEILRCVELLYGMKRLGEHLWLRVRGETGKGDTLVVIKNELMSLR